MKCCPKDNNIKKDWMEKLESESNNVSNNRVIEISDFCKVFSNVSHNLSLMKKNRVISSYNQSKYKYYRIEKAASRFLNTVYGNEIT